MTFAALQESAHARHLNILGGFHPVPTDDAPPGCKTLLMIGPNEPAFWPTFTQSAQANDGKPDPIDRWSDRVLTDWAANLGATALFPFGGPPFLPFYTWALKTGRIWSSPVQFLVHDLAGLMVSFRGALALPNLVQLPASPQQPCDTCVDQPCKSACPVGALIPAGYDVPACKVYLDTPAGATCVTGGCQVRTACPISKTFGRVPAQSEYHMRQFKGG